MFDNDLFYFYDGDLFEFYSEKPPVEITEPAID